MGLTLEGGVEWVHSVSRAVDKGKTFRGFSTDLDKRRLGSHIGTVKVFNPALQTWREYTRI